MDVLENAPQIIVRAKGVDCAVQMLASVAKAAQTFTTVMMNMSKKMLMK